MLSGTRFRSNRAKRAQKYTNEEAKSTLIDAESIRLFVENSPSVLPGVTRQNLSKERFEKHGTSVRECKNNTMLFEGGKWTINQSLGILRDGQSTQDTANSFTRSPRKVKDPSYLIEDREPCFDREIMTSTVSISSCERDDDLFSTMFAGNSKERNNSMKKIGNRYGKNFSQRSEGWDLCNEEIGHVSKFDFNGPVRQDVRIHDDRSRAKAENRSNFNCVEDLLFSDIFKEGFKNTTSCPNEIVSGLESRSKKIQNSPRRRCHSERTEKSNHSDGDLFTDIRFSGEEFSGKNTLREFPWGKDNFGELEPGKDTLQNKPLGRVAYHDLHAEESPNDDLYPGKNNLRHSSEESTMENLYTGKDTPGNEIAEESPPPVEDAGKLMEDSKDLVDELNNSGGDEFTDTQGQRSFVCLVDQLTDLRVRQKFDSHFAGRRRRAVCEELEKAWVWNDKCLHEHRRDLNVRTALSNMFL